MYRKRVSSSRIASVGWENNTMEVEFHNGKVYQYFDVTASEYTNFMNSPSLGHALSILDKPIHTGLFDAWADSCEAARCFIQEEDMRRSLSAQ